MNPEARSAVFPGEEERLSSLFEYDVLDTPAEAAFDDLAKLAAQVCGAPIALVSFVDENRLWFKAKTGLELAETARDLAFCAAAIETPGELLVVPDAAADPRFQANPLVVSGPRVRFYAGAPFVTASGHAIGTLCVLDRVPRDLGPEPREGLKALSKQVMAVFELRRTLKQLAASESRHRELFERNPVAIYQSTPDGRILSCNEAFAKLFGFRDVEEARGTAASQLYFEPADRAALASRLRFEAKLTNEEVRMRRRDGSPIWVLRNESLLVGRNGVAFLEGSALDITEKKTAEVELAERARLLA